MLLPATPGAEVCRIFPAGGFTAFDLSVLRGFTG
jgi:hypothetical protein